DGRAGQPGDVLRVGQVTGDQLHRRRLGEAQQLPGARVRAAVLEVGAGDDLALDVAGEGLPGQRTVAGVRAEVEGGHAVGLLVRVPVRLEGDDQVGAEGVGDLGPRRGGRVVHAGAGLYRLHAGGDHPALDAGGEVPEDLLLGDLAVLPAD